jgi:hypothetical protein
MPLSSLDALLPALAAEEGRAQRSASMRHRCISNDAVVVMPYQIGGESFAVGAVMWGQTRSTPTVVIVHDPRDRQEFYNSIVPFTDWIDQYFHSFADERDTRTSRTGRESSTTRRAPQVIVPNAASAQLLGRTGRRLAFLGASKFTLPPSLIPAGRHLLFLRDQIRVPGQQVLLPLTDLLANHWSTPQTSSERLSLPALMAWIDPPGWNDGFTAAEAAENSVSVGPVPPGEHDERLYDLVTERRKRNLEGKSVSKVESKIDDLWQRMLVPAWNLCWDSIEEESRWPEAPSVQRRWEDDRKAYTRHIDWQRSAGHRRLREKPLQAARKLTELEQALSQLETEEATDDPVRMIAYALRGSAVMGTIVRVDDTNRERSPGGQMRTYPIATIRCGHDCPMPIGKKLFWANEPSSSGWLVVAITPAKDGSNTVTLRREKSSTSSTTLPIRGATTAFSELSISGFQPLFPKEANVPWTHRVPDADEPSALDDPTAGGDGALEDVGDPRDRDRDE